MNALDLAKDAFYAASSAVQSCLCAPSASIKLNGRSFKIIKLLGEGGFSFGELLTRCFSLQLAYAAHSLLG